MKTMFSHCSKQVMISSKCENLGNYCLTAYASNYSMCICSTYSFRQASEKMCAGNTTPKSRSTCWYSTWFSLHLAIKLAKYRESKTSRSSSSASKTVSSNKYCLLIVIWFAMCGVSILRRISRFLTTSLSGAPIRANCSSGLDIEMK